MLGAISRTKRTRLSGSQHNDPCDLKACRGAMREADPLDLVQTTREAILGRISAR
jgi:hypothetical protein